MAIGGATLADLGPVEVRIGTIIEAWANPRARKPALVLRIDLGPLGIRTSSAQITDLYEPEQLVGKQVACVCNLEPVRVAGIKSEVLTLGAHREDGAVTLVTVDHPCPDGSVLA
ncbi:tRNA-binding protein [Lolliginicoccus levis]|uniref:tRNA-binding protein n=1 Tax=Lolliginicoccus levis TaxID=2919542 RepID=UPI00241D1405|nr:tRNA-binding protein [Lolliginicoccus levis]